MSSDRVAIIWVFYVIFFCIIIISFNWWIFFHRLLDFLSNQTNFFILSQTDTSKWVGTASKACRPKLSVFIRAWKYSDVYCQLQSPCFLCNIYDNIFASQGFRSRSPSSSPLADWAGISDPFSISIGCSYYYLCPIKSLLTIDHGNITCMQLKM